MKFRIPFDGTFDEQLLRINHAENFDEGHEYVPGRFGGKALKLAIRKNWEGKPANELRVRDLNPIDDSGVGGLGQEFKVAWSFMLDKETSLKDGIPIVIGQWLRQGPAELSNPSISIRVMYDEKRKADIFSVLLRAVDTTEHVSEFSIERDRWYSIGAHFKPSRKLGIARVRVDDTYLVEYAGPTIPKQKADAGSWKIGAYSPLGNHKPLGTDKIVYVGDLTYSDDPDVTLDEIMPKPIVVVPPPVEKPTEKPEEKVPEESGKSVKAERKELVRFLIRAMEKALEMDEGEN